MDTSGKRETGIQSWYVKYVKTETKGATSENE